MVSFIPRRSGEGRRKRTPDTHCLRMRLISEESQKMEYFRYPQHNIDVNLINLHVYKSVQ